MSDLIRLLSTEENIEGVKQFNVADKFDTLYFPNKLDVRLTAKNACSTLKNIQAERDNIRYDDTVKHFGEKHRRQDYLFYKRHNMIEEDGNYRFRKNSTRICVKRDPVERVLSATKYIYKMKKRQHNPSLRDVIFFLDNFNISMDAHLQPQSTWLGDDQARFDRVYTMDQVDDLRREIILSYGLVYIEEKHLVHYNRSRSPITVDDLPESTVSRIKKIYEIDYDNGWY